MSLTSFLKSSTMQNLIKDDSLQKIFIDAIINKEQLIISLEPKTNLYNIKIKDSKLTSEYKFFSPKHYSLFGNAIDYGIRILIFQKLNPKATLSEYQLFLEKTISQKAIEIISDKYSKNEDKNKVLSDYQNLYLNLNKDFETEEFLSTLLKLALIDTYYRNDLTDFKAKEYWSFSNSSFIQEKLKEELSIINNFFIKKINQEDNLIYNPDFDYYSKLVGGADADIIVNDNLVDFKSSKNNLVDMSNFWQIAFYATFAILLDQKIAKISLYYTKYNLVIEIDILKISLIIDLIKNIIFVLSSSEQ